MVSCLHRRGTCRFAGTPLSDQSTECSWKSCEVSNQQCFSCPRWTRVERGVRTPSHWLSFCLAVCLCGEVNKTLSRLEGMAFEKCCNTQQSGTWNLELGPATWPKQATISHSAAGGERQVKCRKFLVKSGHASCRLQVTHLEALQREGKEQEARTRKCLPERQAQAYQAAMAVLKMKWVAEPRGRRTCVGGQQVPTSLGGKLRDNEV